MSGINVEPLLESKDQFKMLVLQGIGLKVQKLQARRDRDLAVLIRNEMAAILGIAK